MRHRGGGLVWSQPEGGTNEIKKTSFTVPGSWILDFWISWIFVPVDLNVPWIFTDFHVKQRDLGVKNPKKSGGASRRLIYSSKYLKFPAALRAA